MNKHNFFFKVRKIKKNNVNITIRQMEAELSYLGLEMGGKYNKIKTKSNQKGKVAIIVPYQNRLQNLKSFLRYMHVFLSRQNLFNYGVYIVEPIENLVFNRALMLNVGFIEALKADHEYDCFMYDISKLFELHIT